MTSLNEIDLNNATLEDLDNLSIDDLLGQRLDEIDYANLLPTGTYVFELDMDDPIEESITRKDAKPEEDKKAYVGLRLRFRVVKVLACADSDADIEKLVGRYHGENFALTSDFGKRNLASFILGVLGLTPKDKEAISEIQKSLASVLEELREMKVAFGAKLVQQERNGYDNANIQFRPKDMVSAGKVVELLD